MHGAKHHLYSTFLPKIIFSYLFTKLSYLSFNYEVRWEIIKNQNFIRSQSGQGPSDQGMVALPGPRGGKDINHLVFKT